MDDLIKIVEFVRAHNPYPADVFIEPTEEQCAAVNAWLIEHGGTLDGLSGSIGRRVWDACCHTILKEIREAQDGK